MPSMLQAQIRQAIQRTLPNGHGQRHRQIFELARELKAFPTLADAPAKSLRPIVKNWHALAVEKIKTKPLVDTLIDFSEAWGKVKYPKGKGAIDMLFANADQANLPAEMDEYDSDELRQLAALCRELQRAAGEGAFFLDVRTAGRLLGIHHTTAWRYLSFLSDEGIIGVVSKGSAKARRASRYRYLGPL